MNQPLGIFVPKATGAYEVYWNGQRIGSSGSLPPHASWYKGGPNAAFRLSEGSGETAGVLALRFWAPPQPTINDPTDGGLREAVQVGRLTLVQQQLRFKALRREHNRVVSYTVSVLLAAVALLSFLGYLRQHERLGERDVHRRAGRANHHLQRPQPDLWRSTVRGQCYVELERRLHLLGSKWPDERVFRALGSADGLPTEMIYSLQFDRDEDFWMGSDVGLIRVRRESIERHLQHPSSRLQVSLLDGADGLPVSSLDPLGNQGSLMLPNGWLWFATERGIAQFDPAAILHEPDHSHASLEEHVIDGSALQLL